MVQDNTSPFGTAFTVSIEAAEGVTTGISAADRARTILAAVAPRARPGDLVRPGHVFPLRAREGGVLVRTGQTEGSVDLARLAGLFPAGVICEVMNPDGTMARRPELLRFARRHRLTLVSVADLIRYRLQHDRLVKRVATTELKRAHQGAWTAHAYQSDVDSDVHVAMVKGDLTGPEPVLTRMHRACPVGDLLRKRRLRVRAAAGAGLPGHRRGRPGRAGLPPQGREPGLGPLLHPSHGRTTAAASATAAGSASSGSERRSSRISGSGGSGCSPTTRRRSWAWRATTWKWWSRSRSAGACAPSPRRAPAGDTRTLMPRVIEGQLTTPKGRFALCVSRFNGFITEQLLHGATDILLRHGVADDDLDVYRVPGHLRAARRWCGGWWRAAATPGWWPWAASSAEGRRTSSTWPAEVSKGLGQIALNAPCAVSFGVLTCDTLEQAIDRAGVKAGNKGADAALACLEMVNLYARMAEVGKKR